jgi:quercetin dioxygenase-like cupin family protein
MAREHHDAMTDLLHIHTELAPGDPLVTDRDRAQLLRVVDGIVYAQTEGDESVLLPGDSALLPAGEARRVWNAGDDAAHVLLLDRPSELRDVAKAA